MNVARLLGTAQLIVITGSVIMDILLTSAVGSGNTSDILANLSQNYTRMRISNLVALGQIQAIVALGIFTDQFFIFHVKNHPWGNIDLGLGRYLLIIDSDGASAL